MKKLDINLSSLYFYNRATSGFEPPTY